MNRIANNKAKETHLFTVSEAAEYIRVSRRFMYTLFHTGQLIPTHKTGGGLALYSKSQLDKICRKRTKVGIRGRPYNDKHTTDIEWIRPKEACS